MSHDAETDVFDVSVTIFLFGFILTDFLTFHSVCVIMALNIFSFKFLEERTATHLKVIQQN